MRFAVTLSACHPLCVHLTDDTSVTVKQHSLSGDISQATSCLCFPREAVTKVCLIFLLPTSRPSRPPPAHCPFSSLCLRWLLSCLQDLPPGDTVASGEARAASFLTSKGLRRGFPAWGECILFSRRSDSCQEGQGHLGNPLPYHPQDLTRRGKGVKGGASSLV